ncbi:hypothetical protein ACN9MZ_17075 [Pseudoduganella sp. S-14]|jgi:hypothetical protein|uniref:hypothetical protein n=1 Tax=Pseudoduganella sp. S-14 TaxID=3404065 RepID=UPI003CF9A3B8
MDVFASLAGFFGMSYPASLLLTDPGHRPQQALIIRFQYRSCDPGRVPELEDRLRHALAEAGAGEYGGNKAAPDGNDICLHLYGRDADHLFRVIAPILEEVPFLRGAEVKKHVGPAAGAAPQP